MCSIPGLPTPGSEVAVLVTRVNLNPSNGLVELWVNLDDERKHIYEQMREKIQIPKRNFYRLEGQPGDLCLVYINDTWHRARIVSIQSETYNVFLIDQGQSHIATSETLAWGQSDSFLLPPELESCVLANVLSLENNWPEKATTFLMSLPGKKFKGLVQHVLMSDRIILLDIPIVSKHMCKYRVAKKILSEEFKCLVENCLKSPKGEASEAQYFYPELLTEAFEMVIVTEIMNPLNIFCQLQIFSKAVKLLLEQVHQRYEESSDYGGVQPQRCGTPCAARGTNGRWHRSLLKQNIVTSDGVVEVLHVDEGKTESVPVGDIRPLLGEFLRMPVFTYLCSLNGVKEDAKRWTAEETDYLKSQLLNQTVVAWFNHQNKAQGVYCATFYGAKANCINDSFIEKAGIIPSSPEQDLNVQNELIPSSLLSTLGDTESCVQKKVNENDGLQEETGSISKNRVLSGRTDDVSSSGTLTHNNACLYFPPEVQSGCDNSAFTVGSSVDVKVSCIESLQKFWCQITDSSDALKHLMKELQTHYSFAYPQPIVESICVARNPDNGMWYRAKIIASQHSPVVDVRFIDYGETCKVPLQDVRPIDPAFLRLGAQAFQCCLFNLMDPTRTNNTSEFQKFVDSGASSNTEFKCIVKGVTSDEDGLLLNMVDIETVSDSVCKLLAQKCAHQLGPSDAFNYSTYDIKIGGREKVWVTSSESVNNFYCQLERNSDMFDKMMKNVTQLLREQTPQRPDHLLGNNSLCFARYTDNQWYRGQIVKMSPEIKVHFVDHGDTLAVNKTDIQPVPSEASFARHVPVQAVPLGLFNIPTDVPQEVNQWFEENAVGCNFTILVVEKGETGKLFVELFEDSLNINVKVREKIAEIKSKMSLSSSSQQTHVSKARCLTQKLVKASTMTEQNGVCDRTVRDELQMSSNSSADVSALLNGHVKVLDEESKPTLSVKVTLAETSIHSCHSDSEVIQLSVPSCPKVNVNICQYKTPNISQNQTHEVYASSIVGPHYFWCQYANSDVLNALSKLTQETGQAQQHAIFGEPLEPGSPCLALFVSDNQWYRAQVIQKTGNKLNVLFVDYGNESEVDIEHVRSLPQSLLAFVPQAFLCSLSGFEELKGSWDDNVYDDFYNLLVDKPLKVTILNMENYSEIAVPQYIVRAECDELVINDLMQKYWKSLSADHSKNEIAQSETVPTTVNITQFDVSKENDNTFTYKNPEISVNTTEMVYASSVSEPHYFWCQCANTADLEAVTQLAQEAGQEQQDTVLPESLGPGSPCLALFYSDSQWYRALVIQKAGNTAEVLFVDYGNESEVDIKDLRSLPQSLLEMAPQAFLCCLNGFDTSKGMWDDKASDELYNLLVDKQLKLTLCSMGDHSEINFPQYSVEIEHEGVSINEAMKEYWKPVAKTRILTESPQRRTDSSVTSVCISTENVNTSMYKEPILSRDKTEIAYASCIEEPNYFWCQYINTEDLNKVIQLAQKAGQTQQDVMFSETLGPGSPCLALFSSDNQWHRGLVRYRVDDTFCIVFVDYGNETEVDIVNVRPLPQSLLEFAPQGFLCCLKGFDESKGCWEDEAYEKFHNLLVDKPLKLTVCSMKVHPEIALPQYSVEINCEGVVVNTLMEKYWKAEHTVDQDGTRTTEVIVWD